MHTWLPDALLQMSLNVAVNAVMMMQRRFQFTRCLAYLRSGVPLLDNVPQLEIQC